MVGAVIRVRAAVATTIALAVLACAARAAELPDPTRPPALQRIAASASAPAAAPEGPVLQSVLTGPGRKASAIISGRLIEPGGTTHGMRLVQVTETGAVLRGPRGTVTLALTPGADKRAATAIAAPLRTAAAAGHDAPQSPVIAEPK